MFDTNNWNFSQFINGDLKVIINLTAEPSAQDVNYLYSVTVLDQYGNEVHQTDFNLLDDACSHINSKYADFWDFQESVEKKSSGGCSTCVAH